MIMFLKDTVQPLTQLSSVRLFLVQLDITFGLASRAINHLFLFKRPFGDKSFQPFLVSSSEGIYMRLGVPFTDLANNFRLPRSPGT